MQSQENSAPFLTVVIKAFNEEDKISACIESIIAATRNWSTQIIVADSCSTDRTVEIACRYEVMVVRLMNPKERSCGVGGQLGYQFAKGQFLLLIDGDMILCSGFLEVALKKLAGCQRLAGIGGKLVERARSMEYLLRMKRSDPSYYIGEVETLNGGGVYRMEAIRDIGYFTNRNLHSCEEFELGKRLRARGWTLARIPETAVEHYGHTISSWRLLVLRWRSRYFHGFGELFRSAMGKPFYGAVIRKSALFILILAWWLVTTGLFLDWLIFGPTLAWVSCVIVFLLPVISLLIRKGNLLVALYTFVLWNFHAAALVAGFFAKQVDPRSPLEAEIVHQPGESTHSISGNASGGV